MKHIRLAFVGQPNVGKSMFANAVSNASLKVGNFSGVTVEKAEVSFEYQGYVFHIVDLPGTYALAEYTLEEKVTKQFLQEEAYDIIVNVVDATNLERNLGLTLDVLELNKKSVVVLNMLDEVEKEEINLDIVRMSKKVGVPFIGVSSRNKTGITNFLTAVIDVFEQDFKESKVIYSDKVEEEISAIEAFLQKRKFELAPYTLRYIARELLKENVTLYKEIKEHPIWIELHDVVKNSLEKLYAKSELQNVEDIFFEEKQNFITGLLTLTQKRKHTIATSLSQKIDALLIHKLAGIPIFLFFMWALFQITFEIGSIPMDWIDAFFGSLGEYVGGFIAHEEVRSLVVDGIIAGVGAVVLFVPNIAILFTGIALLENTGYMARVAFLLDGFLHSTLR